MKNILLLTFLGLLLFITACPNVNKVKPTISSIIETVLVPAGTFQMGNTGTFSDSNNEIPVYTVTLTKSFYMDKYEVTQLQWKTVMGNNPIFFKEDSLPVENANWYDATDFCNKLSEKEGLTKCYEINNSDVTCNWNANGWRLPTEAEWEYACKAESTTDFFIGNLTNPMSSPLDSNLDKIGWYAGNSDMKTHFVGKKQANAFGLYDMSGNVWEWCWDRYNSTYYTNTAVTDPKGASSGSDRVIRGGACFNYAISCRSSARTCFYRYIRPNSTGFRICRNK